MTEAFLRLLHKETLRVFGIRTPGMSELPTETRLSSATQISTTPIFDIETTAVVDDPRQWSTKRKVCRHYLYQQWLLILRSYVFLL